MTWFQLKPRQDEFAILASDGLWDVLLNNEAVEIVKARVHALEYLHRNFVLKSSQKNLAYL